MKKSDEEKGAWEAERREMYRTLSAAVKETNEKLEGKLRFGGSGGPISQRTFGPWVCLVTHLKSTP